MEVDRISLIDTVEEVDLFQIKESEKSTNNISYPLFFPADQLRVPQFIIDRGFNKKILRKLNKHFVQINQFRRSLMN